MVVCDSAESLAGQCTALFDDQQRRSEMGKAARLIAEANRGALDRLLAVIKHRL